MKYRKLGSSDFNVSVVGFGAWAIGGGSWWQDAYDDESIYAIHASMELGVNLIDTAPVYGFGHSEEVVGRALADRREHAIIATKCGLWWGDDTGVIHLEHDGKIVRRCLEPRTIRIEVEASLRRLRTDYIDLMQTHAQALEPCKTAIADTMACLMDLRQQGKIREIGVSNCTPAEMDEYRAAGVIVTNQPRYNMLDRAIEKELLPYCIENNVAILAYSPLEQGLLTGKFDMQAKGPPVELRNKRFWDDMENRRNVMQMLNSWQDLTEKYECNIAQLVVAWTLAQPGVTVALCGSRKLANARSNALAGRLELAAADLARMRCDVEQVAP